MAHSTPSSSPSSPAPEMLTPRSKVAKMLSDIDNAPSPSPSPGNSPNGRRQGSRRPEDSGPHSTLMNSAPSSPPPGITRSRKDPFQSDSDPDDEDDRDTVRPPQGRAARRMRTIGGQSPPSAQHSEQTRPLPPSQRVSMLADAQDPDSDDELYSATPLKPRPRAARSMSIPPAGPDAGDLFVSPAKPTDDTSEDDLPSNPFGSKEKLAELVARKREERLRREAEEREARQRHVTDRSEDAQSPVARGKRQRNGQQTREGSVAHVSSDLPDEVIEGPQHDVNPDIERIMSDAARPTRKASKKALLEMERETQRLARQQALAHQMKVKKKFTTADLLARFSIRKPEESQPKQLASTEGGMAGSSSAPNSDGTDPDQVEPASTPPSSPPAAGPTPFGKERAIEEHGDLTQLMPVHGEHSYAALAHMKDADDELPEIADVLSSSRADKSALAQSAVVGPAAPSQQEQGPKGLKLARLGKKAAARPARDSDDDDLEIIAPFPAHLQAFDKVAAKPTKKTGTSSKAIHDLRHLSHIGAYEAMPLKGSKQSLPSIGPKTLEAQLRRKAKEQARQEQVERISELKAKGVEIQTAEEREREAEVFENLLEKARLEAQELRRAEKAATLGAGGEASNAADASDDEDEDYDYESAGSEEDMEGEGDGEQDNELVDDVADETDEDEDEGEDEGEDDDEEPEDVQMADGWNDDVAGVHHPDATDAEETAISTPVAATRKPRHSRVIRDDDDAEESNGDADLDAVMGSAANIATDEEDPFAAFNFAGNSARDSLLSPTQAFQATMQTPTQATQEDSLEILRRIAPPSISSLPPTILDIETQHTEDGGESQGSIVPGSQVPESQRVNLGWETQPPETPVPAGLIRGASALSETPGWEPTQDPGLPSPWTFGIRRENTMDSVTEQHETQETVRLRISESPAPPNAPARRSRLVRGHATVHADSSEDDEPALPTKTLKSDAFREMRRRQAAAMTATERAEIEKEMKGMMDDQAEESEDEYVGLGGDDFVAPETEEDRAIIDSSHIDVDERALAAHFAERERKRNEEETNRLYKDLTTGALRRKQANAWGLEEDEDEIAMRKRQMRQREEARKRKLLLKDDNIAGLAEGKHSKGKDAFLKAIADDDDDNDVVDLSDAEDSSQQQTAHNESQPPQGIQADAGPLREVSGNKRPRAEGEERHEDRPPVKQRRTQASAFRKPVSMLEVRESLSFLLEESDVPQAAPSTVDLDSPSESEAALDEDGLLDDEDGELEAEEQARQNDGGFAPSQASFDARAMPPPRLPASQRRTASKPAVVDRLSLKRSSSTPSSNAPGRTAWAAPTAGGFKATLLRRATTNLTAATNDRGVTTSNLSREHSSNVKISGTKASSLASQARAEERRAIIDASTKRREENTARIAQLRRNSSALGRGLTGRFE